jgi:hypothetical protein
MRDKWTYRVTSMPESYTVHVQIARTLLVRMWMARLLFGLAAWVLGIKSEISLLERREGE